MFLLAGRPSPGAAAMLGTSGPTIERHLHSQFTAIQYDPVYGIRGDHSMAFAVESDKGKALRFFSKTVPWDVHIADRPVLPEDSPQGGG